MRLSASLAALALFVSPALAADPPIIRSAKSGSWADAATWEGKAVPGAGSRVLIREGHRIVYDAKSEVVIRGLSISGSLVFATDKDTLLNVGLIKIQAGDEYSEDGFDCDHATPADASKPKPELIVGTPDSPIAAGKTALIRLHSVEGMNKETCPAIVCCGGRMDLHGQPLSHSWVKLGASAKPGDNAVSLAEGVKGW
ncbi:MAG: G8 domain-containing protein, partial [Planctomycetia bacterium]|nr:G8 domain-containing protein [Planctomycetia bacterium]